MANLGVPLILVLGHEKCGAVAAAVQVAESGAALPGSLTPMVEPILPAVAATRGKGGDALANAVRENARRTAQRIRESEAIMAAPAKSGQLKVVAAYYSLETGKVELLDA